MMKDLTQILSRVLTYDAKGPFGMVYTGKDGRRWLVMADYKLVARIPLPFDAMGCEDSFMPLPAAADLGKIERMSAKEFLPTQPLHMPAKYPEIGKVVAQIFAAEKSALVAEMVIEDPVLSGPSSPLMLVASPDSVAYRLTADKVWNVAWATCSGTLPQGIVVADDSYVRSILFSPCVKSIRIREANPVNRWIQAHADEFDIWFQAPILQDQDALSAAMERLGGAAPAAETSLAPAAAPGLTALPDLAGTTAAPEPTGEPAKPRAKRTPPPVVTDLHRALLELDTRVRAHETEGTAIRQLLGSIIKEASKSPPKGALPAEDAARLKTMTSELEVTKKELIRLKEKLKAMIE